MLARMTTLQAQPGKLDELTRKLMESVLPAASRQRGYKSGMTLAHPETGKVLIISVWETETDMLANEGSGYYKEQIAKIASALANPPIRETYKITFQD